MAWLTDFWLAILVTTVALFFLSFVLWAAIPFHEKDHAKLPDEDAVMSALRASGAKNGAYIFPYCTHKDQKNAELMQKWKDGPAGRLTLFTGCPMGRNLVLTFLVLLIATTLIAYIASLANIAPGAGFMEKFRFVGSLGVLAYCFAHLPHFIWFGHSVRGIVTCTIDGVVYGLATGAVFAWLWPSVDAAAGALPGGVGG